MQQVTHLETVYGEHVARVAQRLPLLMRLSVQHNIDLVHQHQDTRTVRAHLTYERDLKQWLHDSGMAHRYPHELSPRQTFLAMLLRACSVPSAILIVEQPFQILTEEQDDVHLHETLLRCLPWVRRIFILDLRNQASRYQAAYA